MRERHLNFGRFDPHSDPYADVPGLYDWRCAELAGELKY